MLIVLSSSKKKSKPYKPNQMGRLHIELSKQKQSGIKHVASPKRISYTT